MSQCKKSLIQLAINTIQALMLSLDKLININLYNNYD